MRAIAVVVNEVVRHLPARELSWETRERLEALLFLCQFMPKESDIGRVPTD